MANVKRGSVVETAACRTLKRHAFSRRYLDGAQSDVYNVAMIRKQLYIKSEHERALKLKARELGVSEAELVRNLLDGLLLDDTSGGALGGAGAALEEFFEEADRMASAHTFPEGYRFDREELYEDRLR